MRGDPTRFVNQLRTLSRIPLIHSVGALQVAPTAIVLLSVLAYVGAGWILWLTGIGERWDTPVADIAPVGVTLNPSLPAGVAGGNAPRGAAAARTADGAPTAGGGGVGGAAASPSSQPAAAAASASGAAWTILTVREIIEYVGALLFIQVCLLMLSICECGRACIALLVIHLSVCGLLFIQV